MSSVRKRSFSLTEVQAKYIDDKVASGAFASGSEVIREGLRVLQMRDAAVERWLRQDAAACCEPEPAMSSVPEMASPIEKVFDRLGSLSEREKG